VLAVVLAVELAIGAGEKTTGKNGQEQTTRYGSECGPKSGAPAAAQIKRVLSAKSAASRSKSSTINGKKPL
jgi:hypothetical protein